ncbi:hypothetical protein TVAG_050130 [Trichomonas vaginalis G3]|uniref:Uncharacterized protein n=1 Tax=Trichomonas vaginalis (strain ATCC PRA-98 / G3) TaxID=412133 RepID=A2EJE1_TRIV3|nr:ubiquitin protein ligase protein [Trichomonas vaginalis G3]EAY07198.1 hypothetical protein TVAG_050130 [Trichomonas vaginalis G3]KAI5533886.1 ubiquitin protein ligase protein [Trichomonas vaginalis G3]|eukprot:XP_001319421.1 hypothetical protein [Trichomonas vaginalis G3]
MATIPETDFESKHKEILNLISFRQGDISLFDFHDKIQNLSKFEELKENEIPTIISTVTTKQFLRKRMKQIKIEVHQSATKIVLSILWSCNYKNEFEEFLKNPTLQNFEKTFSDFIPKVQKIKESLMENSKKKSFDTILNSLNRKFSLLMSSSALKNPNEQRNTWISKIIDFYNFEFDAFELKRIDQLRTRRNTLPKLANERIIGFLTKQKSLNHYYLKNNKLSIFIPFARALIQKIDVKKFDLNEICSDINDFLINIHFMINENDPKNLKQKTEKFLSLETENSLFMGQAIQPIDRSRLLDLPFRAHIGPQQVFGIPAEVALNSGNYWDVARNICMLRNKNCWKDMKYPDFIVNNIKLDNNELSLMSLGAMIALGAEIFDSEITRFIKINRNTEKSKDFDINLRRNSESCFEIDPPNFEITDNLIRSMAEILKKVDLRTTNTSVSIQNCIILSFVTKLFQISKDKQNLAMYFIQLKPLVDIAQNVDVPNYSNTTFCYLIRQQLKKSKIEKENDDRFIPLTHFSKCDNKIISGHDSTTSFFVHTKQISNLNGISFKFDSLKNSLKYIGFISEDWDSVFLSFLDRNIYSDRGYVPYKESISEIVLSVEGSCLKFGNVKIETEETKKRWIFVITNFDDSIINYQFIDKITKSNNSVSLLKQHNFDLTAIFPKICLGMQANIQRHSDIIVSEILSDYKYKIKGIDDESNSSVEYEVSANQINKQNTSFETVMINSEMFHQIGHKKDLENKLIETCNFYSYSLLNSISEYFGQQNLDKLLLSLSRLSDTSSYEEIE